MTKWKCDRAGAICFKPCYAECEGADCAPDKCLFSEFRTPNWERVSYETEQKTETTLPDWCNAGAWVYIPEIQEYFRIAKIVEDLLFDECGDHVSYSHCKQARLRPYNAEEMRGLVGKVLEHNGNASLVIVYLENGFIRVGTKWVSAERLIEDGYTIDGKICGKFEHKNGEDWVE